MSSWNPIKAPMYIAQTSYENRCKDPQIQADLNGWEPDEEFMEWLLKETSET